MIVKKADKEVRKRLDTQLPDAVLANSNVTIYWLKEHFREMWRATRPGFSKVLPAKYDPFDQKAVIAYFHLKGIEYGNWLNQEDRYNYFMALQIALFDLKNVLDFQNLGLDRHVGVAFGARGKSSALAHYEPDTEMINITRFHEAKKVTDLFGRPIFGNKTTDEVKDILFQKTGGMGSFGHEYGHALDYFFGAYIEPDFRKKYRALSQGRSTTDRANTNYPNGSMRLDMARIINGLIWEKPGEKYTVYYATLKAAIDKKMLPGGKYWIRHNELFARAFEVYLSEKLKSKRVTNLFLVKNKYDGREIYPNAGLMKKLMPLFDSLISKMAAKAKN